MPTTEMLHQHPQYKLMEAVAEIARIMGEVAYRPHDLWDMHANAIAWAIEYEGLYVRSVADGSWEEDAWLDNIDDYVRTKLTPKVSDDTVDPVRWSTYFGRRRPF